MKKIMCLFVMFLISNAANAADKWEYVIAFALGDRSLALTYPDGKTDFWTDKETKPPKGFGNGRQGYRKFFGPLPPALANRDFGQIINVVNALGLLGFEMCGVGTFGRSVDHHPNGSTHYWFKRKIQNNQPIKKEK